MFGNASARKRNVTLYTSLPPRTDRFFLGRNIGAAYQRACIESWLRMGFDVTSLNSPSEIHALSGYGYEVTYHQVASERPRIVDFVEAIQESAHPVAGIINADCLLVGNDGTIESMLKAAEKGLVLMERINLRAEDAQVTGESCCGFDFLCFSTDPLHLLKFDDEISIGTPWWDYWFPLAYQQTGGKLYAMAAPILMHLNHPQNWSWQTWTTQGRRMHAALSSHSAAPTALPFVCSDHEGQLSDTRLHSLAVEAFEWLKKSTTVLDVDDPDVWLLLFFLSGIDRVARELSKREASLAAQASTLTELRAILDEHHAQLAQQSATLSERAAMLAERDARIREIEESTVWKLTRPIRAIASGFPIGKNGKKMVR
jgi:hypothetical protein